MSGLEFREPDLDRDPERDLDLEARDPAREPDLLREPLLDLERDLDLDTLLDFERDLLFDLDLDLETLLDLERLFDLLLDLERLFDLEPLLDLDLPLDLDLERLLERDLLLDLERLLERDLLLDLERLLAEPDLDRDLDLDLDLDLSLSDADIILLRPLLAGGLRLPPLRLPLPLRLLLRDFLELSDSDSEVDIVSLDTIFARCFAPSLSSAAFAARAFSRLPIPFSPFFRPRFLGGSLSLPEARRSPFLRALPLRPSAPSRLRLRCFASRPSSLGPSLPLPGESDTYSSRRRPRPPLDLFSDGMSANSSAFFVFSMYS